MVSWTDVLSEGDYSDGVPMIEDGETKTLSELQIVCDQSYSMRKEFDARFRSTPDMGFVEPREARQRARKRKGRIKKPVDLGEPERTTVDMLPHPTDNVTEEDKSTRNGERANPNQPPSDHLRGRETWPLDFRANARVEKLARDLRPYVTDVQDESDGPKICEEDLALELHELDELDSDCCLQRATSCENTCLVEQSGPEMTKGDPETVEERHGLRATQHGEEKGVLPLINPPTMFAKVSRTGNKKNRRNRDKLLYQMDFNEESQAILTEVLRDADWRNPLSILEEVQRLKGTFNLEGVRYLPSAMKKHQARKRSTTTSTTIECREQSPEPSEDIGMSTVVDCGLRPGMEKTCGSQPPNQTDDASDERTVSQEVLEAHGDSQEMRARGVTNLVYGLEHPGEEGTSRTRRGLHIKKGRHRLDKRYSADGSRQIDTLLKIRPAFRMSPVVDRLRSDPGDLSDGSTCLADASDEGPGRADFRSQEGQRQRSTSSCELPSVLTATEKHPIPLGNEKEEDLLPTHSSPAIMRDGWPQLTTQGQPIPRVIDMGLRDSAGRAEKIYGRDAIGFPTTRRVADGYRRQLSGDSEELVRSWADNMPEGFLGDCLTTEEERMKAARLLYTWRDLFTNSVSDMPATDLVKHEIPTRPQSRPKTANMPLYTEEEKQFMAKMLPQLMAAGVLAPCRSTWCTKTKFVRKKSGKLRMVHQFMALNDATIKDAYPMTRIEAVVNTLGQSKLKAHFQCDAANGYWAVPLDLNDAWKTAFPTTHGQVCYLRMGQGLCGAPRTYSLLKMTAMGPIPAPNPEPALDDISEDIGFEAYMDDDLGGATTVDILADFLFDHYLPRLAWAKLTLNPEKCRFFSTRLDVLGFVKDEYGLRPSQDKQDVICQMPPPETEEELDHFCALLPYISECCLPGKADLVMIMKKAARRETKMIEVEGKRKRVTKKLGFEWTVECQRAFEQIKTAVAANCVSGGDSTLQYHLSTDASATGLGGVLFQLPNHPPGTLPSQVPFTDHSIVKYMSFQLTDVQTRYHTTEREFLAVLMSLEKVRYLVCGSPHPIKLYTDHTAVKDILKNGDAATGRIARWQHRFGEFNYEIMHVPGKEVAVADGLSRMGTFPYTVRECDFPTVVSCLADDVVPNDTEEEWKKWLDEPWYRDIVYFKLHGEIPLSYEGPYRKTATKRIAQNARRFTLVAATEFEPASLAYIEKDGSLARCIPQSGVSFALNELHEVHGHWSDDITIRKARGRVFWPTRCADIRRHCRTCHNCQMLGPLRPSAGLLPVLELQPMDLMAIDFMGPISPQGPDGERYIIVVVDYATRYCWAFAMTHARGADLVVLLDREIFSTWGFPRGTFSDNASQFSKGDFNGYLKSKAVKVMHPGPGAPSSVGLAENFVKLIKKGLQTRLQDKNLMLHHWPKFLASTVHNIRTRIPRFMGYSSAQMMFGYNPRWGEEIPGIEDTVRAATHALVLQTAGEDPLLENVMLESRLERIEEMRNAAADRAMATQAKQAENFRAHWETPRVGDLVLKRRYELDTQRSKKLEPRWIGPFVLDRFSGTGQSAFLRDIQTGGDIGRHAVNNLKLYVAREETAGAEHWRDKTNRSLVQENNWSKVEDVWEISDPDQAAGGTPRRTTMVPVHTQHPHLAFILNTEEDMGDPSDTAYWLRRSWSIRREYPVEQ